MSEQMPELTEEQLKKAWDNANIEGITFNHQPTRDELADKVILVRLEAVAKAQRELLEDWRKVPSVEEITKRYYSRYDCSWEDAGEIAEWLHRWFMEGK